MSLVVESQGTVGFASQRAPRTIRKLSPLVVNKIAAGEVIERPASVVKELLENSIDAGATRIVVDVEQGGCQLIRVTDDGCGMTPDQLPLALASHATSKIFDADDLFQISTLGFRGEALASISAVSQLRLSSRTSASDAGATLSYEGGESSEVAPCGAPIGTSIEVKNLFFNTPVRRKFLRSTQTEMGHISEAFTRVALANPHVHLALSHNGRVLFDLPAAGAWLERIATLCGDALARDLMAVSSDDGEIRLAGFVAHPQQNRPHNRMQYLFLNGRHIRDRSLQHALGEAYRGLLMVGRYPIAFLRLEMPPDAVDVNVHPTKLEVRFQDSGRVYSQLLGSIRKRFLTTDLTAGVSPKGGVNGMEGEAPGENDSSDSARTAELQRELVQWAQGAIASAEDRTAAPLAQSQIELEYAPRSDQRLHLHPFDRAIAGQEGSKASAMADDRRTIDATTPRAPIAAAPVQASEALGVPAMQVHNRYLVAETQEGMVVIDQHALHERILYEQLRERVQTGKITSQRLLVPEAVELAPAEAAAILDAREMLAELGMEVESFGGGTILLSAYPSMLANMSPAEVLRQVLEPLMNGGREPNRRDLFDHLLHGIACKAAIKAGDRLTPAEIERLLELRHLAQDAHHCPHGRPTALVFTREELDRRFGRI